MGFGRMRAGMGAAVEGNFGSIAVGVDIAGKGIEALSQEAEVAVGNCVAGKLGLDVVGSNFVKEEGKKIQQIQLTFVHQKYRQVALSVESVLDAADLDVVGLSHEDSLPVPVLGMQTGLGIALAHLDQK